MRFISTLCFSYSGCSVVRNFRTAYQLLFEVIFFAKRQGRCSENLCFYLSENHWRDLTFAFVFEGVLFEFAYAKPAFALLFALPLNRTPQEQPTFIHSLLQIVPRPRCPHRYPAGKFIHLSNLGEDVLDFPRIGEKLACIAVVIVPIHLDFDERSILSELRFHSLDVVADPKGEVNQLLLRRFRAVEMLVGFVGGDFQKIQRAVILHRIVVILHCRIV
nr:MAG TPA: hypothetical protein [Bacteriophage sp.]